MDKKKKIIGGIAIVVVLLLVCIPFGMNKFNNSKAEDRVATKNSENKTSNSKTEDSKDGDSKESDSKTEDSDTSDSNAKEDKKDDKSKENDDKNTDANKDEETSNSDKSQSSSSSSNNNSSSNKNNTETSSSTTSNSSNSNSSQSKDEKVSSNFKTPDASLTIQRINGYSGIYVEDGSDKEVENVAAIQVKNTSNKIVEYGEIEVYNGDKKLTFQVSTLPANSSVIVMEKDKKTISGNNVTYGKTTVAYTDKLEKDSNISYSVEDNNGIKLTNKSSKDIKTVRVFYKYKSDEGYYIGGITYVAKVENLKAGKSETIYPSHFDSNGGEVMMIKTYNK